MGEVFRRDGVRPARLACEDDAVGGHQGFAGHARIGVDREKRVEHGVADPVSNLVGVTFGDRFGRKEVLAGVAHKKFRDAWT